MTDKLKLSIVGCGDIAGSMAWVSRLVRQVELDACVDINRDRAQRFAQRHNIPQVCTDYGELLESSAIDAVYLAVPHNLHYEMILAAIEAGKHVLVEKPITRTLEEGKRLVALQADVKIGVNYQYRYDNACYALARAVQAGHLGKIHAARINIPWHRTSSYFEGAAWHRTISQAGGGTLITQGSHFLDIVLWALGEHPVSAMGYAKTPVFEVEVDTLTHGIVETEGGTLVSITSSMVAAKEQAVTIDVYGEAGTALYRSSDFFPRVRFVGARVRKQRAPERGVHALQRSLAGFAHWVLDDKPYLTPADETIPVLAAVDAIYRSARSGQRELIALSRL
ncbi:MAG: Gfo/Idh/MocA family oxidoreductase [Anaerolineae bacterium]|nr:Gfo/Idh/MocA family oxidoreductase [Anaerolineae bacterium]